MSPKFEVKEVRGKGLGVFALKDIRRGELILKEDPILSYKEFDDLEEMFRPMKVYEAFTKIPQSSREEYLELDESYISTDDPEELRRTHPMYLILKDILTTKVDGHPLVQKVYRIFMANHHALEVFAQASRINHSCKANAGFRDFKVNDITASVNIKAGEEITFNYVGPILNMKPKSFRQQYLLMHRGFQCLCDCCLDEREDDSRAEYQEYKELKAQLRPRRGQKRCSVEQCLEQIEILKRMYELAKKKNIPEEEFISITSRGLCFAVIGYKDAKSAKKKAKMETCEEEVKRFAYTMGELPIFKSQERALTSTMLNTLANHPGKAIKKFKFLLDVFEQLEKEMEKLPIPTEE